MRARAVAGGDPAGCDDRVAAPAASEEGRLGVVAEGAFADLLVVDGDPTRTLEMFPSPKPGAPDRAGRARCIITDTLPGPA